MLSAERMRALERNKSEKDLRNSYDQKVGLLEEVQAYLSGEDYNE